MIVNCQLERILKQAVVALFGELSRNFTGRTEENLDKPQSGKPALDHLGIVHTKKYNTQMRKTGINMIQNFTEFY
jgi:hypothetical protein